MEVDYIFWRPETQKMVSYAYLVCFLIYNFIAAS